MNNQEFLLKLFGLLSNQPCQCEACRAERDVRLVQIARPCRPMMVSANLNELANPEFRVEIYAAFWSDALQMNVAIGPKI